MYGNDIRRIREVWMFEKSLIMSAGLSYFGAHIQPVNVVCDPRADELGIIILFASRFGQFVPAIHVRLIDDVKTNEGTYAVTA
jgi:hypothetical protein